MFYVDETLVGDCSCEAKLSTSRIDHGSKNGGQKINVWCGRDVILTKELAFGVDETTLDLTNVHLVQTRRSSESAVF